MDSILGLNKNELAAKLSALNLKPFRASQILEWIYKKHIYDFPSMHNISISNRKILAENFSAISLIQEKQVDSTDMQARKYLFRTSDNYYIESVLIKSPERHTLCISTQVGCALNCIFCGTGKRGFKRDLKTSEILSQILLVSQKLEAENQEALGNIVYMGMGDRFLNYDLVMKSLYILND